MLRRRDREARIRAAPMVIDQPIVLLDRNRFAHIVVEACRPVVRRAAAPADQAQVVNDVAAADDQHAFVAQRRELHAERVMKRRRLRGIDRELHDRHVRRRKRMLEH